MAKDAAQRKRESRARQAEHKAKVGATTIRIEIYRGTAERLADLEKWTGLGIEELLTCLIEAAHKRHSVDRDMSQNKETARIFGHDDGKE